MGSERLKANTPKRWADPSPEVTFLKYFFLLSFLFFAILCAALLAWYIISPPDAWLFIHKLEAMIHHV
jgi:hypothetical protein